MTLAQTGEGSASPRTDAGPVPFLRATHLASTHGPPWRVGGPFPIIRRNHLVIEMNTPNTVEWSPSGAIRYDEEGYEFVASTGEAVETGLREVHAYRLQLMENIGVIATVLSGPEEDRRTLVSEFGDPAEALLEEHDDVLDYVEDMIAQIEAALRSGDL